MKKSIAMLVAFALSLTLTSCGAKKTAVTKPKLKPANASSTIATSKIITKANNTTPSKDSSNTNQSNSPKDESGSSTDKQTASTSFNPIVLSDTSGLQTKKIEWSWLYSPRDYAALLKKYHGYAFGDTSQKVIYLTFDEGYEYGCTPSILDTLKSNNVKAAFFCTKPFVTGSYKGVKDSELIKRMANEGHIIGNHTVQHKSMPTFLDETSFNAELTGVEQAVAAIPGCKVSKFFRPPMGEFSELSLYYTQRLGYRSIFFAFAYNDYDVNKQPEPQAAKALILKYTKPGMICLLHAESKTNAEILDSLIKEWKSEGYVFKTLNDLQ